MDTSTVTSTAKEDRRKILLRSSKRRLSDSDKSPKNRTGLARRQPDPAKLKNEIEALCQAYANEDFEDGMESEFIDEILSSIEFYGSKAVAAISKIIFAGKIMPHVACEALRWLGDITHEESYPSRLRLLERSLSNSSRWIRDGAALGLASLQDAHAIPYLREAVGKEKIQELREDMEAVLALLGKNTPCQNIS